MPVHSHLPNLLTALNDDILFQIMNNLTLADLVALRSLCSHSDDIVATFLTSRLRTLLARFFDNVDAARTLMRNTNSVISGSSALAYVLPSNINWQPHDLDLYVPNGEFTHVVNSLVLSEHYTNVSPAHIIDHYTGPVERVVRLQKDNRNVDVIQSASDTALHPIAFFWLTAVTNYVSADHAYVGYPELTFAQRALLHPHYINNFHTIAPRANSLIEKYQQRDFDIRMREISWSHYSPRPGQIIRERKGSCASIIRFFGDDFGLTTPIHTSDTVIPDITARQRLTVLWRRGGIPCGLGCVGRPRDVNTFAEEVGI
ncbi:hypothetical protein A0H81_03174 [Grifola frondosa]|uniref:F-box domain-containing protein n=1 Tax=Grifola frondosa TaxID=5627 RepID=A0A1C7MJF8_GRIFR|nr:hypothetical protein A0H81_03174 [Grifola frondosa]